MATNTSHNGNGGRSPSGQHERETILLTREGYEEKKARLEFLKKRRAEIADYIHEAKEAGDISESSAYEDAKNLQAMNEGAILELEHILENAEVLETPTEVDGKKLVRLGSTVDLETDSGRARTFQLVSSVEADTLSNKLSDQSPVGKALLGKAEGDRVEATTQNGTVVVYTIRAIH
jgi:transcription elongation factor GreA